MRNLHPVPDPPGPAREAARAAWVARAARTRRSVQEHPSSAPSPRTQLALFLNQVDEQLGVVLDDLDRLWSRTLPDPRSLALLGPVTPPTAIRTLVLGEGKRIRPTAVHLGWVAAGGPVEHEPADDVILLGAALELLHVFALVHDDVMDASATRRGRPTVHEQARLRHQEQTGYGSSVRFGDSVAVLVGDLAHAEADALVAELPVELRRMWRVLVVELFGGQLLDVVGSASGRPSARDARRVARMKSGAYTVERPLLLGAAAAGATDAVRTALSGYGREVGAAFALRDDLLGVWGDPVRTGKPAGDDLLEGKPTMIMALGRERLTTPVGRALLTRAAERGLREQEVRPLQDELNGAGVAEEIEDLIAEHIDAAARMLDGELFPTDCVTELMSLAHRVAWRDR